MKFSLALKILGYCFFALLAEAFLAYFIWSNYAFDLAGTGEYTTTERYTTGPMANLARTFYVLFGLTAAIGLGAPLFSLLSMAFRSKNTQEGTTKENQSS